MDIVEHGERESVLGVLADCVAGIPWRLPAYAALVMLMNAKQASLGKDVALMASRELAAAAEAGDPNRTKAWLRFVGELAACGIIPFGSFAGVLKRLLELARSASEPAEADALVYFCCHGILWGAKGAMEDSDRAQLSDVLGEAETFMVERDGDGAKVDCEVDGDASVPIVPGRYMAPQALSQFNKRFAPDSSLVRPDVLSNTWAAVRSAQRQEWKLSVVPDVRGLVVEAISSAADVECHADVSFEVAPETKKLANRLTFKNALRLIGPGSLSGVKGLHAAELSIAYADLFAHHDLIVDNLRSFYPLHDVVAQELLVVQPEYPIETILVETIMIELLALPAAGGNATYYTALLVELCGMHEAFPTALGLCSTIMFNHVAELDVAVTERFASWLATHVSNFAFSWLWDRWAKALTLPELHPKSRFLRLLMRRIFELAFHERVLPTVPEAFHSIVPAEPVAHSYLYANADRELDDDEDSIRIAGDLMEKIKAKLDADGLGTWLSDAIPDLRRRAHILMHALLIRGSKSYSHVAVMFNRYQSLLDTLCAEGVEMEGQIELEMLECVEAVWSNAHDRVGVIVAKLYTMDTVTAKHVARWSIGRGSETADDDIARSRLWSPHIWEVVMDALRFSLEVANSMSQEVQRTDDGQARERLEEYEQNIQDCLIETYECLAREVGHLETRIAASLKENADSDVDAERALIKLLQSRMCQVGRTYRNKLAGCWSAVLKAVQAVPQSDAVDEALEVVSECDLGLEQSDWQLESPLLRDTIR